MSAREMYDCFDLLNLPWNNFTLEYTLILLLILDET